MEDKNELLESVKNEIEEEVIANETAEKETTALRSSETNDDQEDAKKLKESTETAEIEESEEAAKTAENDETENADASEERETVDEILEIILGDGDEEFIRTELDNYHENDIAEALTRLSKADRIRLYKILGDEKVSEIFAYIDDVSDYL
ncbi:MAG: hypothetical protein K6F63_08575, partial [Lachnospiraceae bacterium]|nr:hypothetical protein [Lachnospiraceae bacterium]